MPDQQTKAAGRPGPAVATLFDASSDSACAAIRSDVDAVLSDVSKGGILPTTSNDHMLTDFMMPDDIPTIRILLNRRLSKYDHCTPFKDSEITENSDIGDVRQGAYTHCSVSCSHI
jgi:hypothetical protein